MDIMGNGNLRFNLVGDKVLWNLSIQIEAKSGKTWMSIPTTLKKEIEEEVKKEFKARTWKTDDKYIRVYVKKGFISGYLNKENKKVLKLVVTDLTITKDKDEKTTKKDDVEIPF